MATQKQNGAQKSALPVHEVTTALNKDDKSPVKTNLRLDWTGVTPEECHELAARTVIINWQRIMRANEKGKAGIPTGDHTLEVKKFMAGEGRPRTVGRALTPERVLDMAETMDPKAAEALMKKLQARVKEAKK